MSQRDTLFSLTLTKQTTPHFCDMVCSTIWNGKVSINCYCDNVSGLDNCPLAVDARAYRILVFSGSLCAYLYGGFPRFRDLLAIVVLYAVNAVPLRTLYLLPFQADIAVIEHSHTDNRLFRGIIRFFLCGSVRERRLYRVCNNGVHRCGCGRGCYAGPVSAPCSSVVSCSCRTGYSDINDMRCCLFVRRLGYLYFFGQFINR